MSASVTTLAQAVQQYEAPAATQAEHVEQWAKVDAFLATGFVPCEDIYVHAYNAIFRAIYLCPRGDGKAGIAILRKHGKPHVPCEIEYSQLTARLDTPRYGEEEGEP